MSVPEMPVQEKLSRIKQGLDQLGRKSQALSQTFLLQKQAEIVLVVAAKLDRILEGALRTKMNTLNSELNKKLFGDYGSLRDFSTKIDLSFALGLVDSENYKCLTTIRKIRNAFAHADDFVDFNTPAIQKLLLKLTNESSVKSDPTVVFVSIAKEIELAVTHATDSPDRGIIDKVKAGG